MLLGCFNIRSLLDAIFVSTLLHFGAKKSPKSRLGGVLGRLVGVLSRLGSILKRLGAVLGRLGVVLGRLGSVLQAQESETMNFQWFLKNLKGVSPRAWHARAMAGRSDPDP